MPNNYVIDGSNDDDGDGLPTYWSNAAWGWVEFKDATRFNCNILRAYTLPVGSVRILDVRSIETHWHTMAPSPAPVGVLDEDHSENVSASPHDEHKALMDSLLAAIEKIRKSLDK